MNISVILCTYNRCCSLAKALESAAAMKLSGSWEWEMLVVDNNSSDRTREVVEEVSARYPGRLRYLFEPRQGKSHALNAGIREARGEILAFMDDDVVVEQTWLHNLTANLYDSHWAGAAGRIRPQRNFTVPRWLPLDGRLGSAPFALFDLGPDPCELREPPFGTNMAFRKAVFEKYGGFRTDLGPRPGSEMRSEDSEFGQRLLDADEHIRYEPSAVVYHEIPESRVRKSYFLAWWRDKARADIRAFGVPSHTKWFFAGVPIYLFRRFATWIVRWLITIKPSRRFSYKLNVWINLGAILECYRETHTGQMLVRTEIV
jgi:glucosyl-dolichyl phosphate glucuronosyltransferase